MYRYYSGGNEKRHQHPGSNRLHWCWRPWYIPHFIWRRLSHDTSYRLAWIKGSVKANPHRA